MPGRTERGSASALVLLLLLLVGAVAWNYHRNLEAESREFRPYRGYAQADLDALIGAYEQAEQKSGRRYDRSGDRRTEAREAGDVMGNIEEFERVQGAGRATRAAREDYAAAKASLEILRKERSLRAGEGSRLRVFLRRAFTF